MKNEGSEAGDVSFGVAETGVIIWIKYSIGSDTEEIIWELNKDAAFFQVTKKGKARVISINDFAIAMDVQNIAFNRKCRFIFL